MNNWQSLLPKKKSDIEKAKTPKDWKGWEEVFANEVEKPLGKAMKLGADVAQEEVIGITVDWTLQNPEAQQFLRKHSLKLAKGINSVTQKKIRSALLTGVDLGEGTKELAKRVRAVLTDATTWRSRQIAQTETIRAYSQGSIQLYKKGGVEKKVWLDGQEGACPICEDLDNSVVKIDENFAGGYDGPPAHPSCRCAISGIVDELSAENVDRGEGA